MHQGEVIEEIGYQFMSMVLVFDILVAHGAYLLRGLYDAYMATVKVKERANAFRADPTAFKKKPKSFDVIYYLKDNALKWVLCYVALWVLLAIVPEIMMYFGWEENWNAVIAAGCGFGSLEIIQLLIRRGKKKLKSLDE